MIAALSPLVAIELDDALHDAPNRQERHSFLDTASSAAGVPVLHVRAGRRLGSDAGDADVWIISSALQYKLPLMSHDQQQIALARASGLTVETAHPQLRSQANS